MLKTEQLRNLCEGKTFLITGHTGFKGAYMVYLLKYLGARVCGYAKESEKGSLTQIAALQDLLDDECIADIRDYEKVKNFVYKTNPHYILHMAAQPLVLDSYEEPKYTFETNILGTVNVLEAIREINNKKSFYDNYSFNLKSFLNVTTDKVYKNDDEENHQFREDEPLCGFDPYSNSKSCSELVTYSYKNAIFKDVDFAISTARAGNVIGGGDIAKNRIIPDCVRDTLGFRPIEIRNPYSTRPYQYVLEPLICYLNILLMTAKDKSLEGSYNVGPDRENCVNTLDLAKLFVEEWNKTDDYGVAKINVNEQSNINKNREAKFLMLDNSLLKHTFKCFPMLTISEAVKLTVNTYKTLQEYNPIETVNNLTSSIEYCLKKV